LQQEQEALLAAIPDWKDAKKAQDSLMLKW
jgi:hypothetical protein